ncbi:MAG: TraR/DksA C4-type zinc finger protein [Parvibaculum sp.]|nr:TraR/DksA C4-type zinc finger protein [Parvibaculum sp.]
MAKVIRFTGGQRCKDCGDQIPPARLRASPSARKCVACQTDREQRAANIARAMSPNDIAIIKG